MVTVQQPPVIPGHQIQHIEGDTWVTFHELHQRFTIPGQCQAVFHRLRREGVNGWDSATSWTRSAGLVMLTVASRQITLRRAYSLREMLADGEEICAGAKTDSVCSGTIE
jgi:hypothetical protein